MPGFSSDRNLLFGILALQMDFISRDALVAAMHAWVLDKAKPLGQVLVEQGALDSDNRAWLDAGVQRHLAKHHNDPQQSLAAVSSIRSVRHDLQAIADADVQASLAVLPAGAAEPAAPPTGNDAVADSVAGLPTTGPVAGSPAESRFRRLRPHARGGLGEVHVALDVEVNREVALKEIQERYADQADARARFLREAEITGKLEHPGVVPVYGLGSYPDGRPYYAMRFIQGDSLHDAIAAFHAAGRTGRSDAERSLELRQLLGRFVAVCNAVGYAHSRGVIHRDLKPANVMLGKHGETLVVDWGLAKVLDQADVETSEGALVSSGDSTLTQAGQALGTPAYMSPEQAAGRLDQLGPASDAYSLGATLYCLLTGKPPFSREDVGGVLAKVQKGDFPPPRQVEPRVPPPLEAVCLKAMARKAADRYASCRDLADEIERWLADEPVRAQREPWRVRLGRWVRKHQTATAWVGALLLSGVLALGVSTLLIGNAKRETDRAVRDRALSQVNALAEASPGAVPGILADLEANRETVLPHLRELYADTSDRGKRMRLALALLPVEPQSVREELFEWLLSAEDPAEVVLVREVLVPHGQELKDRLWRRTGSEKEAERFRALVALAKYDPTSGRWTEAGKKVVAQMLLAEPLHLRDWVAALEPVSDSLLVPLGEVFRDRDLPERRVVAANVLAKYVGSRPDELNELLLDADGRQYALLRPLLDKHREAARQRMKRELSALPDWWKDKPLDAAWKTVPATWRDEVEQAGGLMAERFALCLALPLARLAAVTEGLRGSGYRPVSVRPWASVGQAFQPDAVKSQAGKPDLRVAVVWTRDGRDWRLEEALTAAALKERDGHWQKAGLIPADVAAYAGKDGDRYLALWRRGAAGENAVLYAGVAAPKHNAQTAALAAEGYLARRLQTLLGGDGVVRCAGVWERRPKQPENGAVFLGDPEPAHAGKVLEEEKLLADVHVGEAAPSRPLRETWLVQLKQAKATALARPGDPGAIYQQATALFHLGRDAEAIKALDTMLAKLRYAPAYRYRALLHARAGQAQQAKSDLAAFAKGNTDRALGLSTAAVVGMYLGEAKGALSEMDRAVEANPKDPALGYEVACAHGRAAQIAGARQTAWAAGLVAAPRSWASLAVPAGSGEARRYAERALALLEKAMSGGYRDFTAVQSDADLEPLHGLPGYRALLARHGMRRSYASVWQGDATRQATGLHGLTPEAHLKRCRELAGAGWRPVGLSVAAVAGEPSAVASSVWQRPVLAVPQQERVARRQATAAATLLHLKDAAAVWPLFRHTPDPSVRSYLVQRAVLGGDAGQLVARLEVEKDVSARRALILALGECTEKKLPAAERARVVKKLLGWYRDDPDPGIHGAIDWLLGHGKEGPALRLLDWGQGKELERIDGVLAKSGRAAPGTRQGRRVETAGGKAAGPGAKGWYVNGQGQTMVRIKGPVQFRMGSPHTDPDYYSNQRPALRRIARNYALASKPVTVEQWQRFLKERPEGVRPVTRDMERFCPEGKGPMIQVTLYMAAQYCNWLSEKEGIAREQWCYPEKIESGMRPMPDYLKRTGYRLPTEAEWEYACRAGAVTSRYYGNSVELLPRYAWYQDNSKGRTWPVGQKRPNDLGLFDMHGNVMTWTTGRFFYYPRTGTDAASEDTEDISDILDSDSRVLRGATFVVLDAYVRAVYRTDIRPVVRGKAVGVRVARTYP